MKQTNISAIMIFIIPVDFKVSLGSMISLAFKNLSFRM